MRTADIHTIINHFSIALVVLGILIEYYSFLREEGNRATVGWWLLRVGTAFLAVSLLTGFISEGRAYMDAATRPVSSYHKLASFIAFAILGGSVLLRMLSRDRFHLQTGAALRGAYLTLLTVGLMMISATVYFGMELVYQHGVSVVPYEHLLLSVPPIAPASTVPGDSVAAASPSSDSLTK